MRTEGLVIVCVRLCVGEKRKKKREKETNGEGGGEKERECRWSLKV